MANKQLEETNFLPYQSSKSGAADSRLGDSLERPEEPADLMVFALISCGGNPDHFGERLCMYSPESSWVVRSVIV